MKIYLILGDCLEKLKELPENSVDSIVTDPPYELGFMGKSWDNTGIANDKNMWAECLRVLKPGGHLLAFSGTRTYHRMAVAIEDAGFEVRDMIEWVYASGFPKSLNVHKALQKKCTCGNMEVYDHERTKQNTEHDLRPMPESDLSQEITDTETKGEVLQSELSEQSASLQQSKSTENVRGEESLLEGWNNNEKTEGKLQGSNLSEMSEGVSTNGEERRIHNATQASDGTTSEQATNESGSGTSHRPQSEQQQDREPCSFCKQWGTQATRTFGIGTALKPAHEPICMARKPLVEKTVAENVLKYGTGGINIDESRVFTTDKTSGKTSMTALGQNSGWNSHENKEVIAGGHELGRFPANLIHDNSEEVRECFPETKSGWTDKDKQKSNSMFLGEMDYTGTHYSDNSGNASRFFKSIVYQAKASKSERNKGLEDFEEIEVRGGGGRVEDGYDLSDPEQVGLKEAARKYGAVKSKKANTHPTVKPIALMEYLIKMVTPKGGIVLDPFMGSGSTGVACMQNSYQFIGIELELEYMKIAEQRLKVKEILSNLK